MKNISKIVLTIGILIISFIILQLINHEIIEQIIIGDSCKYDTDGVQTGWIFNLFYTISSDTGYHPEPSMFNFIFTTIFSLFLGSISSYYLIWKKSKS